MDNQTDDRDTDQPPVGTPEELEEALKWLEELTARQGKTAELSNPVPPTSLDSPFRGLIDNDEGELPDWLREVPKTAEPENFSDEEPESRLDWLAKMAQRESIEELPTLEWRRLSDPIQSTLAPDHQQIINETIGQESALDEKGEEFAITSSISLAAESPETPEARSVEAAFEESVEASKPVETEEEVAEISTFDEEMAAPVETAVLEDLSESIALPDDEELPSLDDLDAAMAWIEELAASQEAPIEDVPSVADRALASKLMMEAGITPVVSPLDELGSDSDLIENLTPTHPFIEEEDFADTIVLVETMAADQGMPVDIAEDEPSAIVEVQIAETVVEEVFLEAGGATEEAVAEALASEATPGDPADELSFEDAMAYLDGLVVAQPTAAEEESIESLPAELSEETSPVVAPETDTASIEELGREAVVMTETEATVDETLSIDDAPWKDDLPGLVAPVAAAAAMDEPAHVESEAAEPPPPLVAPESDSAATDEQPDTMEEQPSDDHIEVTLRALDAMALPPGKSLDGIDAALRAAEVIPVRDVTAALAWLETALAGEDKPTFTPQSQLEEEALIAQMPDDPDAVLAWLEQMAGEEPAPVIQPLAYPEQAAGDESGTGYLTPPIVDITEADLLDMPEDPDEAMLWLEGLARGGERPAVQPAALDADGATGVSPEELDESSGVVEMPRESESFAPFQATEEPFVESIDESLESSPDQALNSSPGDSEGDDRRAAVPPAQTEQPIEEKRRGMDWIDLLRPLE